MNDEVVAVHSSCVVKFPFIFIWFGLVRFERPIYTYTFVWIRNIEFHKNWWPSSGKIPRIQFVPHWNSCCLQNHASTGLNENEEWKTDEMKTILWTVKRQQNGLNIRHTPYWWITLNYKSHWKFISQMLESVWSKYISRTFSNGNENKNKYRNRKPSVYFIRILQLFSTTVPQFLRVFFHSVCVLCSFSFVYPA